MRSRYDGERENAKCCSLAADGALWIIRPKGSAAVREPDVNGRGKAAGLVEVKVARLSASHTAEKYAIGPQSRVGITAKKSLLPWMSYKPMDLDPIVAVHLPLSERVLDRLADIMFASDEILDMIGTQRYTDDEMTGDIEQAMRLVYNKVNDLMKKLSD